MDKATLVGPEIEKGQELLRVLDHAKVKVSVLLWAYLSEYEDWRLIVAGRQFDAMGSREGYRVLFDALASAGFTLADSSPIMMLPMSHAFIKDLRRIFGKTKSVEGMRFGLQLIGDRWVEEAYAYRIS
jgi:hypothetical protein